MYPIRMKSAESGCDTMLQPMERVSNGSVLFDATADKASGVADGLKIDVLGNIWATGPSAVYVFSPGGKLLGTIKPPEDPANCAWGDGLAFAVHDCGNIGLSHPTVSCWSETGLFVGIAMIQVHVDLNVAAAKEKEMLRISKPSSVLPLRSFRVTVTSAC